MTATATNLARRIEKIEKIRVRTIERGASANEAESAARMLGKILMENPALQVIEKTVRFEAEPAAGDEIRLRGVRLVKETRKALFLFIPKLNRNQWVPKCQIMSADLDCGEIIVSRWIWSRFVRGTAA